MIKIFSHYDYQELETLVNNWIQQQNCSYVEHIKYAISVYDCSIIYSVLIVFHCTN